MSTYATAETVERANAILGMHLESDAASRCLGCGDPEPCQGRATAYEWFAFMGALPRRAHNRLQGDNGGWSGFR